jgi:hypothetical protein
MDFAYHRDSEKVCKKQSKKCGFVAMAVKNIRLCFPEGLK